MQINSNRKAQGFTIIEVVLVLAIAGLIFLMVFLALPALQRSQRDTQRKNDAARFMSQVINYQSNNAGTLPSTAVASPSAPWTTFITNYLTTGGSTFNDPSTNATYIVNTLAIATAASTNVGTISLYGSARCNGSASTPVAGTGGQIALIVPIEQGGFYCAQN